MSSPRDRWLDEQAGPVVRPYAMTQGRTRPRGKALDLITIVMTTDGRPYDQLQLGPEHQQILRTCRQPTTVADITSDIGLPLTLARVLLGDLHEQGLITALDTQQPDHHFPANVLEDILTGLQAL